MPDTKLNYRVTNPASGEVLETFDFLSAGELEDCIAAAYAGYQQWRHTSIDERSDAARRIAELLRERKEELAGIMAMEMGKSVREGASEVAFSATIFEYFADNAHKFLADERIETLSRGLAVIQRLPIGVILGIMPWNYPYYQVARFVAPNIILGNTILLKHSELCPRSALAIQSIMDDAGIPSGVYRNIFASHEQVARIIADPRVEGVSLTGSRRAASAVGALAGQHIKKSVLELGGSDPYIILDSDDIRAAARAAWRTRMGNTGQACNSNKRMIVMDDLYDDFVDELVQLAGQMQPAAPHEAGEGHYCPLSSRKAAVLLDKQVKRAVEQGAILRAGGKLADDSSAFYSPAVLTDVTANMDVYGEELFGPVAVVYRVSDDEEATRLANDTEFGLGGAVFSKDAVRASRVAGQLDVGMSNVNVSALEGAEVPFGGVKRSGFGRELGPLAMDEFVNKRVYFVSD